MEGGGTLIHRLLEHAMRHDQVTYADLHRLATWLSVEEPQLRPVLDRAVNTVLGVSKAEFWQEAARTERSVETPFTHSIREREIVSGVIDLMFRGQGAWQIVDYKTDLTPDDQRYKDQLEAHRSALRAVGCDAGVAAIVNVRVAG